MKRDRFVQGRKARWIRNVAALAVVFGMFAATPVTAWADNNGGGQGGNGGFGQGGFPGFGGGGDQGGNGFPGGQGGNGGDKGGSGGGNNGQGQDGGHSHGHGGGGDHNSTDGNGGGANASVPEVPYAMVLPIVIIGMTVFVYRRRTKSA